jgi:LAO/AO transport system kinase
MKYSEQQLKEKVLARDYRAVARLITRIESNHPTARALAASMRRPSGQAHVVGVTGSPGAGKSTLVDHLALEFRRAGASVAILAVDPSSPFSGGAILGDRIRMNRSADDADIFIRSMATRGSLGGLAKATLESVHVLDCAGFDVILLETVGVGQAEVDVVRSADTCVVVLVPGMGDSVQIIKAGLMEIADLFVINKADRDGALILERDLLTLMSLVELTPDEWKPRVVKTVATEGTGTESVVEAIKAHRAWLESSTKGYARRLKVVSQTISSMASEWIAQRMLRGKESEIENLARACVARTKTPLEAVQELIAQSTGSSS